MRRRFREATEVREIKEAQRPGNSYQQHMATDGEDINPFAMLSAIADGQDDLHAWKEEREGLDPLEMKDTIEDDEPEDEYDLDEEKVIDPLELKDTIEDDPDEQEEDQPEEEMSEEELQWEKINERTAKILTGEIPDPDMDEEDEYPDQEEEVTDPLELKDTIEDDPDEPEDVLEETNEEDLWWEKQLEKDAANLRGEIQAPEMDEDIESIEAFEKEQTKGKERTAGLEDKER